ncbi:hypothetical protein [Desulfitobacterium hafniense]|uniref:Transposase n=2 Tax=Desulfitobacterium hafniense TaxID=49338 RepID=A0A098B568_DESHA|nr:hypothetical protein [Desulfitobacterium hafniense]EHL06719.1 hypothetical protein HMPREF0322_02562 [Desulfitobacterium hafniense DP7]KTE89397.1 hypothetical protein AT727_13445 [Desulfitobacterium hafniense]CDX04028.1 Hypothetical protein DPCES_4142 [Desulfitobacterium hafniense]
MRAIFIKDKEIFYTILHELVRSLEKVEDKEKGLEKGVEKGKLEVAKNLLELGIEMEKIVKATGLPEDEIKKLMN